MMIRSGCFATLAAVTLGAAAADAARRQTLSLDGVWAIADGTSPTNIPAVFPSTVPVPGLANLAQPPFPNVDWFISRENLANRIRENLAPPEWMALYWTGKVEQARSWFWYRTTFRAPAPRALAMLKINKAQFGTAVWLNGMKLGEHAGCFTAGYFDLTPAIRWNADNVLVVRIGAHPAVLPDTYPTGSDFEKNRWTPGIYDRVSVYFCDNPAIEHIQVAPRLAASEALIQTALRNRGAGPATGAVAHVIREWASGTIVATAAPPGLIILPAGAATTVVHAVRIPNARRWSPEDPFLYAVETSSAGDTIDTRFGLREFRFDAATKRAYLNGEIRYLRGSNITLHRFFEDPLCRDLPWNEKWVRTLLGDLPRRMHWNYFRFCIGPVPDRWLDICDEVGLMIQNEFFVWTGAPTWYKEQGYSRAHDPDEIIRQYTEWMRDNWNHPSVVVWDANNETKDDIFNNRIIPAVRPLDLSNRPWENSYNRPAAPDDPVEDHPYLMIGYRHGRFDFKMTDLETMDGRPRRGQLPSDTNPPIINEYGWLWLNRDGTPTRLTEQVYEHVLGTNVTPRQRLDMYAYLLAAKTEFWRAHRHYAGILHFVFLTCSYPGVYTADHFADVTRLELDPAFVDYVGEAFKPLGVYLNFFQPTLTAGAAREFTVMMINDEPASVSGVLTLSLATRDGIELATARQPFDLPGLDADRRAIALTAPDIEAECILTAAAISGASATRSRRWVRLVRPPPAAP